MLEWQDVTSYSRNDKERMPRVLELKVEDLKIKVHRIIHCEGWFLTCNELLIDDRYLYTDILEEAKNRGIEEILLKIKGLEKIKDRLISYGTGEGLFLGIDDKDVPIVFDFFEKYKNADSNVIVIGMSGDGKATYENKTNIDTDV